MALPTLETDRFIIRPLEESDIGLMIEMDTDGDVMRYLGGPLTEEQVRAKLPLVLVRDENRCHGFWSIRSKESDEAHGWILIKPQPLEDPAGRSFTEVPAGGIEIGYRLKKTSWGRGVATEAAKPFLPLQFDVYGLDRLIGSTLEGNEASQNVLKKLGMRYIGEQPAYGMSLPSFELTAEEWRAANEIKEQT